MEISIKWNICRVCLQEEEKSTKESPSSGSDQMQHLFNEDKKLAFHIYQLSGVLMKPDDHLPDKVCCRCVSIVNSAVKFRKNCRSSNVYLHSVLKRTKTASTFFRPEIRISDDEIVDDDNNVEMEIEPSNSPENDTEQTNLARQEVNVARNYEQKEEDSENMETTRHLEQLKKEVELELEDNSSSNTIELDEIIEISQEAEEQMFTQTVEDFSQDNSENSNINSYLKAETSQLQKFYMSANFSKSKHSEEEEPDNGHDNDDGLVENGAEELTLKENNEEMYPLYKDIKNKKFKSSSVNKDFEDHEEQSSMTEEDFEYLAIEEDHKIENDIEESLMLHLEDKTNDNENQPQVSSTVDTCDEIEFYEHESNASNLTSNLGDECLVDQNFSNCNISSSKLGSSEISEANLRGNTSETKSKHSPKEKSNSIIIFPRRKPKRNWFKSSAYAPVKVCVCEICGNQFTNRNLMSIHMKVHYQEKNHQCELCFKSFITACNLQAHMRIHTGEKPFVCKYCDRRFNDRSSNLRHERTHTNEKPFKCCSCGKSFSLTTTLQNHMKVHTNERSYRCEPCGKSFKLAHHLKTHQNTSLHRSVVQKEMNEN